MINLFVGNLSFNADEDDLTDFFVSNGLHPHTVKVITDRDTGRSRGFAFVEFEMKEDGERAIAVADGVEICGRRISCNEAKPREPKSAGAYAGRTPATDAQG